MPGTAASITHSAPPATDWTTQLDAYLREAGSNEGERRKAAELRLAIFPHAQVLTHLPGIWRRETRRRDRLVHSFGATALLLALTLIPISLLLIHLRHQEAFLAFHNTLDIIRLAVTFLSQAGLVAFFSVMVAGNQFIPGAVYTLVQHQCVELVPLLIEALPGPHQMPAGVESRRPQVMAALTRLLPRFAFADREPLTRRQQAILTGELRKFNRTLRNPLAALTPEEADFLTTVLHFLSTEYHPSRQEKASESVTHIVEDLAVERTEYHQEPAARTLVREAARAALVRLSAG